MSEKMASRLRSGDALCGTLGSTLEAGQDRLRAQLWMLREGPSRQRNAARHAVAERGRTRWNQNTLTPDEPSQVPITFSRFGARVVGSITPVTGHTPRGPATPAVVPGMGLT